MTTPAQQLGEQISTIEAKLVELGKIAASHGAEIDGKRTAIESVAARTSDLEAWKEQCNCGTVDVDPPAPDPAPTPINFDLESVPKTVKPGDQFTIAATGIEDGSEVWVHWFTNRWASSARETVIVGGSAVDVEVPDLSGDHILQLQYPSGHKEHVAVKVEADVGPAPAPTPTPTPTPGIELPAATHTIRLQPGENRDIAKQLKQGQVNRIVGNRDCVLMDLGYIDAASVIIDGPRVRATASWDGARFAEARPGTGASVWMINSDFKGRDFKAIGGSDTFTPFWQFDRVFIHNSTVARVRRAANQNGFMSLTNSQFEDIWEDFFQGGGKVNNCTLTRMGWPVRNPPKGSRNEAHCDIFQPYGVVAVDGFTCTDYVGRSFALGNSVASGSSFSNINISGSREEAGEHYVGAQIENKDSKGGPSNIKFANVVCDKSWLVQGDGESKWLGQNIAVANSAFAGKVINERFG